MKEVYIIAEAGQNHNGSMELAKQIIDMSTIPIYDKFNNVKLRGVNAVKFTKRDLSEELTEAAANKEYNSQNSFGKTYGEHRAKLELSYEDHEELFHYTKSKNIDFVETFTSPKTLQLLNNIDVDYIKVASRDLTNIPLLQEIGKAKRPTILSTGMGGIPEIDNALEVLTNYHEDIVILHCISQYPALYKNLNLRAIPFLKKRYPYKIGYSDHSIGIVAPVTAIALGAEFIEKHITLSHSLKGSDHKGALEPDGLWRMVRDIRNMEVALGEEKKEINAEVESFRIKLERSLVNKYAIKKGEILTEDNLIMLSPGGGMAWNDKELIVGKNALEDIDKETLLDKSMFE